MRKLEVIFWIIVAVLVVFLLGVSFSYRGFGTMPLILNVLLLATGFLAGARFARLSRRI